MIDLTKKGLPKTVEVNGKSILLKTDFRVWIDYYRKISTNQKVKYSDLIEDTSVKLFPNEIPLLDKAIADFFINPNPTPNYRDGSKTKTYDYYLDGSYIYSAFMRLYGIDLSTTDMHWHKFKALCDDITDKNTTFGYAKFARGYEKPSKEEKEEQIRMKEKIAWSLPVYKEISEEEKARREANRKFLEQVPTYRKE